MHDWLYYGDKNESGKNINYKIDWSFQEEI